MPYEGQTTLHTSHGWKLPTHRTDDWVLVKRAYRTIDNVVELTEQAGLEIIESNKPVTGVVRTCEFRVPSVWFENGSYENFINSLNVVDYGASHAPADHKPPDDLPLAAD
jgi:hypothetical protein